MKRVDVLRNDGEISLVRFKLGQRQMRGVGFNAAMRTSPRIIEVENERGIALKSFGRRDITPIVFGPDPIGVPKRGNTAFRRQARARQDDDVVIPRDQETPLRYAPVWPRWRRK